MTREMTTEEVKEEEEEDEDKENKEEEKMTRIGKKNPLLPTVLWAQRRDRIFLTFEIKNAIRESIKLEVRNPYPLEAMEEEKGKGAALGYVGTSVVVFSCGHVLSEMHPKRCGKNGVRWIYEETTFCVRCSLK